MTRNTFFSAVMFAFMAMFATNMNAQHRGGMDRPGMGREMRMDSRGGFEMRGGDRNRHEGMRHEMGHREMSRHEMGHREMRHHDGYREMHGHRWDRDGWMMGYHGRVRHFADGRWGYLRNGAWYYYDCFYEPSFYYAHPLSHFHAHIYSPAARRAVATAVGTAAVVSLISALVY